VAYSGWLAWSNRLLTRGVYLACDWVPRGPIMGYHVAPGFWLFDQNFLESVGFDPQTSPPTYALTSSLNQYTIVCCLLCKWINIHLNLNCFVNGGGSGRGLSPTRGSIVLTYNHILCLKAHRICVLICNPRLYILKHVTTPLLHSARGF
jgi:hypothetical protein